MQMHVHYMLLHLIARQHHAGASETDQPQALSLCAARRNRADREGCRLRTDRYRSFQQAGVVLGKIDIDPFEGEDRKSTRLNSSHVSISYAVFCLKKKTCLRARPQLWQLAQY